MVGVLALQGGFEKHKKILDKIGVQSTFVKNEIDLYRTDALIIPGGESTTLRRTGGAVELGGSGLLSSLFSHLRESNSPVLGTCAGAILLCDPDDGGDSLLPAAIDRNAYGRQKASFQDLVKVNLFDSEFPGVFIRAPRFVQSSIHCDKVATHGDEVVGILHKSRLALTFHPELTDDPRFHVWLLQQASNSSQ